MSKEIPKGHYCYFGTRAPDDEDYKPCPYWEWLGNGKARCNKFNVDDDIILWDQVKLLECIVEEEDEEED